MNFKQNSQFHEWLPNIGAGGSWYYHVISDITRRQFIIKSGVKDRRFSNK